MKVCEFVFGKGGRDIRKSRFNMNRSTRSGVFYMNRAINQRYSYSIERPVLQEENR